MIEGASMPWYGSVSLLRQRQRSDWRDVLAAVHDRLDAAQRARAAPAREVAS